MNWAEIQLEYNKAKDALWCPEEAQDWRRDEETGYYYMLSAYHKACQTEPKDYLLYARILSMMADERRFLVTDYDLYHKYVKPSAQAYELAEAAGQHPTEKELDKIHLSAEFLKYKLDCEDAPYEEQLKWIHGYEQLVDFGFHDSKPVWFELAEESARLKLKYGDVVVTFLFEGITDIHVDCDPVTSWIEEFYCYPSFHNKELLVFDAGYYKITCASISVEKIEREAGA